MTTSRTRSRLRKLRVDRIDLVPEGAQPDAHITLYKSADDPFEAEVAKHRSSGLTRPEAVVRALDERPDLYETARGTAFTRTKAAPRPETLRERITGYIRGEARAHVSKSATPATRAAVAATVVKLLDADPGLANLAALGSMPQAVLPVDVAVGQLRAMKLVTVDEALDRLGL